MKPKRFTGHARAKFNDLAAMGFHVTEEQVYETLDEPERVVDSYRRRKIAQAPFDEAHVLRVVFEETDAEVVVVTFYPGRRSRYESTL